MSFLAPVFLFALPLIGLPFLIHLLNQRRHKTVPWAARYFVLQASNMGRGAAKIRHRIVLLLRAIAIAAIVLVVSRPMASSLPLPGILGSERAQIVIVDRSPSMAQRDAETGLTTREISLGVLQQHLQVLGSDFKLYHSLSPDPVSLDDSDLLGRQETTVTDSPTDLPELIERALKDRAADGAGPTDIWVCTDRRATDWRLESGRWSRIRQELEEAPELALHFIAPNAEGALNLAISATARVAREGGRSSLYVDLEIQQTSGAPIAREIPVKVELAHATRDIEIDLRGRDRYAEELKIELPEGVASGGGVVRLPQDSNESDNHYYFTYAPAPHRQSVIVSDDENVSRLLELVCTAEADRQASYDCQVLTVDQQVAIDWEEAGLVLWHAPLPSGPVEKQVEKFVSRGGTILFLPPEDEFAVPTEAFGVRWGEWESAGPTTEPPSTAVLAMARDEGPELFRVAQWRTNDDLLATDESGRSLPLKSIACLERRQILSEKATQLASFEDGKPLLVRAQTAAGGAYFLATTPDEATSTFTEDGVALYVLVHRALEQGAQSLAVNRQVDAATGSLDDLHRWTPLECNHRTPAEDQRQFYSGVYRLGEEWLALNRPLSEDDATHIEESRVEETIGTGHFDVSAGTTTSLESVSREIWKLLVALLVAALLAEGWTSLPPKRASARGKGGSA